MNGTKCIRTANPPESAGKPSTVTETCYCPLRITGRDIIMKQTQYAFSKICYIIQETAAYFITLLLSGAYLAKLTTALGFSDGLTAILTSFVSLGCGFQMLSLLLFRGGKVKARVTVLYTINQLLFALIYLIPIFNIPVAAKNVLFVAFLLTGHFIMNVVFAPKTNWFMALIPDYQRGIFTSVKEGVTLILAIVFQLIMGTVIDRYEAAGNIRPAFILCATTIFVICIIHSLSLIFAKEKDPAEDEKLSLRDSICQVFSDKKLAAVIFSSILWSISSHISIPFFGTFQIKELGFSMSFVSLLAIATTCIRVPCSVFLGKYADNKSFAKMLKICYISVALSFLAVIFTVPSNGKLMFLIYTVFYLPNRLPDSVQWRRKAKHLHKSVICWAIHPATFSEC